MTGATQTATAATGATTIIDFNIKDWDDPGSDRVVVDNGAAVRWRYTADRYQKLKVKAKIEGSFAVAFDGVESISIDLYKNAAALTRLDYMNAAVFPVPVASRFVLKGDDQVELNKGDYFDIRITQNCGGNYIFDTGVVPDESYITIEEI
jgi:hypothetical protein